MAKSDLRIDILGTSITISTDEDAGYLQTLLSKYRGAVENIQRVSGLKDPLKIAVLTGFLLCDDLQKAGTTAPPDSRESGELEQLTLGMISRLEEALEVSPPLPSPPQGKAAEENAEPQVPKAPVSPPRAESQRADAPPPGPFHAEKRLFKLQNTVKHFTWGSPKWIPELLGQKNISRVPWAELWMGVHPAGPSRVIQEDGKGPLLSELIDSDPESFLGKETAETFGKLPFLLKVEAAAKPLSIQAHPNKQQAEEGFLRENREGIPLDAPNRNYRDANHKPEILCALSSFAALCGFRDAKKIIEFLDILYSISEDELKNDLECLLFALEQGIPVEAAVLGTNGETPDPSAEENPLRAFLSGLFRLDAETFKDLGHLIKNELLQLERDFPQYKDEWYLCSYLSGIYPGDPGILAPLYLNIIELEPGQAIYLPAGILHAYVHGMGIELMADSDNVLRGGLTPKHVDLNELLSVLDFSEYKPELLNIPEPSPAYFTYPAPVRDFALSSMHSSGGEIAFREKEAAIVILTKGSAAVHEKESGQELTLNTGESVFIPAGEKAGLVFSGTFTAYVAAAAPHADTGRR
ncbi:MAG: mannose-6-phosphate isomerase, class I [Treponema sp.]|nr:mannose-6-phosphate isomerase, class I [Treponema sp.]